MRFKLNLSLINRNQNILPVNYQYELSAWIYKVINNLKENQKVFTGQESTFVAKDATFTLLSQPRQKGITIKAGTPQQSKLVGYQYNFKIKADAELLRMGYYCGFGEKNSLGFGCCETL